MTNAELIAGLRWCADESICCDDFSGEKCPYYDEKKDSCSVDEILHAAADALEAADKRIAKLEVQEPTEKQVVDYCRKRCLVIIEEELFQRMKSTFSRLPKEGEWIEVHDWLQIPQEERGTYRCSACGQVMKYPWNYCPNCGARMRGEQDEQIH